METGTLIILVIVAGLCIAFGGQNIFKNKGGNGGSGGNSGGGGISSGGGDN